MIKTLLSWTANCIFINPITFNSEAIFFACFSIVLITISERLYGGKEQAESPEWIPACSICCKIPPIWIFSPSEITSTSTSIASVKYPSSKIGFLSETSTASFIYFSSSTWVWTSSIALPPRTYDGLTTIGKPISPDTFIASSRFLTVLLGGCLSFNWWARDWKRSLSSDLSIASTSVPRIFTLLDNRTSDSFRGVCPPNCIITPSGFSKSIISKTFSSVIGSK